MNSKPVLRTKKLVPSVGFRGSAVPLRLTSEKVIRSQINLLNDSLENIGISYRLPFAWSKGQILRNKAISRLMSNDSICSDFSVQIRGYISQRNAKKKEENRKLFVKNIIENDYILCVRGAGNYSFRLYETLSAGRIPIIVNTDCVLPYDFVIDWKKYCVWVEESDIDKIDEILLDYHQRVSKEEFLELQVSIRKLWEEWVSPVGFFKNFDKHLHHTEVKQ